MTGVLGSPGMEAEEGSPLWRLQKLPPERGAPVRGRGESMGGRGWDVQSWAPGDRVAAQGLCARPGVAPGLGVRGRLAPRKPWWWSPWSVAFASGSFIFEVRPPESHL